MKGHEKYNSKLPDHIIDKMKTDPNYPMVKKGGATDQEIKDYWESKKQNKSNHSACI